MEQEEIEYGVDQKREGKLRRRTLLLIALYLGFLILGLVVVFTTAFIALGALIPLFLYTLYLATWRFVEVEQKYVIQSGSLIMYRKFGNSKPKRILEIRIKSAKIIAEAPACREELAKIKRKNIYNALPSRSANDAYAIIYEENGVDKAVLIQVIDRTLRAIKYYAR